MEFSGQYLNYEDYRSLGGSTLDLASFDLLEFEARKRIDSLTQLRLKNLEYKDIPQEVKICIYNLMNKVITSSNEQNISRNSNVSSESTDGYSVTYLTPTQIKEQVEALKTEINDIITNDLFGVIVNNEHLIYTGV